jgi:hypothetical protein
MVVSRTLDSLTKECFLAEHHAMKEYWGLEV